MIAVDASHQQNVDGAMIVQTVQRNHDDLPCAYSRCFEPDGTCACPREGFQRIERPSSGFPASP
jgi:hypothetical protein